MATGKIDLRDCSLEADGEGIVELHMYSGQIIEPDKVREIFDTIHNRFPDARYLLVTAGDKATLTPDARNLVSSAEITSQIAADAIVTEHYSHQMAANFFVRYNRPQRPTRLFRTREEAVAWLRTFDGK